MANGIVLKHGIRAATVVALLAAIISSSQLQRFGGRPGHDNRIDAALVASFNRSTHLRAVAVKSQPYRMKALSSEREPERSRPLAQARGPFDLPASSPTRPFLHPDHSGPSRTHNPLRC